MSIFSLVQTASDTPCKPVTDFGGQPKCLGAGTSAGFGPVTNLVRNELPHSVFSACTESDLASKITIGPLPSHLSLAEALSPTATLSAQDAQDIANLLAVPFQRPLPWSYGAEPKKRILSSGVF